MNNSKLNKKKMFEVCLAVLFYEQISLSDDKKCKRINL